MSALEETLLLHLHAAGLPEPVRELRFAPPRRWRFDLAWPEQMVAVEVDGGLHVYGRHNRPAGYENDCAKGNEAIARGWRLLRFTQQAIESGAAVEMICRVLRGEGD